MKFTVSEIIRVERRRMLRETIVVSGGSAIALITAKTISKIQDSDVSNESLRLLFPIASAMLFASIAIRYFPKIKQIESSMTNRMHNEDAHILFMLDAFLQLSFALVASLIVSVIYFAFFGYHPQLHVLPMLLMTARMYGAAFVWASGRWIFVPTTIAAMLFLIPMAYLSFDFMETWAVTVLPVLLFISSFVFLAYPSFHKQKQ